MRRILFVDDEPRLLEGLERMLRPQRKLWQMQFAIGAEKALAVLDESEIDVVVTDMRMPGMDGASLLQQVQSRFPGVVRIILSGQFGEEAQRRAAPVAHQFLTKPCSPEILRETIERHMAARQTDDAEGGPK
jgi:DNA-binding NtrC family response regulator